jgi:hypothetical protein
MLQLTLHLTRSSRLWALVFLGIEVFLLRSEKKATLTVFMEIHKGVIFDPLKINMFFTKHGSKIIEKHKNDKIFDYFTTHRKEIFISIKFQIYT